MIKHIVMWNLEDVAEGNSRDENARRIKKGLESLKGVIDGIIHLEVGINVNPKGSGPRGYAASNLAGPQNFWRATAPGHRSFRNGARTGLPQRRPAPRSASAGARFIDGLTRAF